MLHKLCDLKFRYNITVNCLCLYTVCTVLYSTMRWLAEAFIINGLEIGITLFLLLKSTSE